MKTLYLVLAGLILALVAAILLFFYPYIFSKTVYGEMLSVERVGPQAVLSNDKSVAFSYAVALRTPGGEIFTASSEDRQWGAWDKLSTTQKPVYCAEARLYPYPPWDLIKAGTYHDARLLKVEECKK